MIVLSEATVPPNVSVFIFYVSISVVYGLKGMIPGIFDIRKNILCENKI